MKLRPFLWAFLALVVIPVTALALQTQRSQIGITILINVTPNPLGYHRSPGAGDTIVARAHLHGAPPAVEREFQAEELHFAQVAPGAVLAQAANAEKSVKVEAEITPNPNATLLTSDAPGYAVVLNAEAGVTATFPCAYHVKVQTTITSWQLKEGLAADFTDGSATWSGNDVANNSYISAPQPTATPFQVFADNGGTWSILGTNSGTQLYCVDLTLNIPIATAQGTYSSNAIYTLYY